MQCNLDFAEGFAIEGKIRTASLTKVATDDEPLLSRSCLGQVAVL
jgi:hypothetical protein